MAENLKQCFPRHAGSQLTLVYSCCRSQKNALQFKMFDVEKNEWGETNSVICEEPIRQLVGTNSELIIITKAIAKESPYLRAYRLPIR